MKLEDVKVGMKVVPHSKNVGCTFDEFNGEERLHRKNDAWLYVYKIWDDGIIVLSPEINDVTQSTHFLPEDIEQWCDADEAPEGTISTTDPVNHPSHYTSGEIECIDAIKASMTREAFLGFLKGSIIKYCWRYEKKINPAEDIKKAGWYRDRLEKELQGESRSS